MSIAQKIDCFRYYYLRDIPVDKTPSMDQLELLQDVLIKFCVDGVPDIKELLPGNKPQEVIAIWPNTLLALIDMRINLKDGCCLLKVKSKNREEYCRMYLQNHDTWYAAQFLISKYYKRLNKQVPQNDILYIH